MLTLEEAASEETSDKIVLNDLLKLPSLPTSTSRPCVGLDTVLDERGGSDCQVSGRHHDDDSDAICCMDETNTVLTHDEREEEEIWLVESGLDELCLAANEVNNIALIDSACPTTVAGVRWLNMFVSDMPQSSKENLKVERSSRVYKFGGGERRASKGAVTLPYGFEDYKEIRTRTLAKTVSAKVPIANRFAALSMTETPESPSLSYCMSSSRHVFIE